MPDDQTSYQPIIPEAVRRQAARAEELVRLARGETGQEGGEQNPPTVEETDPVSGAGGEPGQHGTEREPPAPPRTPPEPTQPPADDWQQRYQTLQGKYSAEVPRLTGQLRALEGQVSQLQSLLSTLRSAPASAPAQPARAAPRIPSEDIEAYGEDLVTATRRWARAEVDGEIQQLRGQVEQLSTRSQQTETTMAQRSVEQVLDAEIKDWREVNVDPAFTAWLDQVDPFSGRRRHDMLGEAYVEGNGPRTAAFFKAYANEQTVTDPALRNPTHTPPSAGRVPLEQLAAPGRGPTTSPASGGAPNKRLWSRDQITAFYQDKALGKYEARAAEAARMEKDIFEAQSEGRIR
jgi:hypothetical protein